MSRHVPRGAERVEHPSGRWGFVYQRWDGRYVAATEGFAYQGRPHRSKDRARGQMWAYLESKAREEAV